MPTVTINIAARLTPLSDGTTSKVGHMWYSLKDGNGSPVSYGFSPIVDNNPFNDALGPGKVNAHGSDDQFYTQKEYSRTIEITQAQYDAMKNFGENPVAGGFSTTYNGLANSCIDFTWKALEKAGLNPSSYEGKIWPTSNIDQMRNFIELSPIELARVNDFLAKAFPLTWPVDPQINRDFTTSRGWTVPRDPLVLDLDGDGIETVGISPGAPILFDHDADGTRTGTGWIKSDDGLLVLDVNGNGLIDSGRELFGDNTRLGNPANNVNATNGYQALAQHDSNGDGKINSTDAIYSQLRIWRDLNQDGISQANELQTLAQTGIANIGVAGTASNTNLGNGNTQLFSGTFTRTNGTAGQSGVAELSGSLLLASNNFYRQFTDNPALTTAAKALPQMQGSGIARNLRETHSIEISTCRKKLKYKDHIFTRSHLGACKATTHKNIQMKPKLTMQKQSDSFLNASFVYESGIYIDQATNWGAQNYV